MICNNRKRFYHSSHFQKIVYAMVFNNLTDVYQCVVRFLYEILINTTKALRRESIYLKSFFILNNFSDVPTSDCGASYAVIRGAFTDRNGNFAYFSHDNDVDD